MRANCLNQTNTMKRTKKQIAERKARSAEIAALYATVANGGNMQENYGNKVNPNWIESDGPTLSCDLSYFRAIPAPRKPEPKKPEPRTWWLHMKNGRVVSVMPFDPVGADGEYVKVREVEP